ncbi:MAG: tetratricopeptide repeat protein [Isosphaeraceae bacterium]|nr:tetratricopeptide repeat protein [Isosphaeraceae bacterium]
MSRVPSIVTIVLLGACSSARADVVSLTPTAEFKAPGNAVRGTVQSESPSEVTVKLGNNITKVPTGAIVSITYDNQPPDLVLAQTRENAGNFAEAADLYKKAAAKATGKPFVIEAALFGEARVSVDLALTDPSKTDQAIQLLEAFGRTYSKGRHVVPALEALTRLYLGKGDYAKVDETLTRMSALPQSADRAAVLRARVFSKKGEFDKAVVELDKIIAASAEGSVKRRDAQLAKAEALVGGKKFSEAETLVRNVIKAAPAEDVASQSLAHNMLGDCLRAAGKPREALYAYLHTDLLFFKDREQHPRALARIAEVWRELRQEDRAGETLDRLRKEYPRSPYVAAAR